MPDTPTVTAPPAWVSRYLELTIAEANRPDTDREAARGRWHDVKGTPAFIAAVNAAADAAHDAGRIIQGDETDTVVGVTGDTASLNYIGDHFGQAIVDLALATIARDLIPPDQWALLTGWNTAPKPARQRRRPTVADIPPRRPNAVPVPPTPAPPAAPTSPKPAAAPVSPAPARAKRARASSRFDGMADLVNDALVPLGQLACFVGSLLNLFFVGAAIGLGNSPRGSLILEALLILGFVALSVVAKTRRGRATPVARHSRDAIIDAAVRQHLTKKQAAAYHRARATNGRRQ